MEDRLTLLEARLRRLEDELAIHRLVAAYGPAVDSGQSQLAAALWMPDGVYDVDGMGSSVGTTAIASLFDGPVHQELIAGGAGHVLNQPHIRIDGDRAVATGYSVVFKWNGEAFTVFRVAANRWELERCTSGWKVARRINRLMCGSQAARALLEQPDPGGAIFP